MMFVSRQFKITFYGLITLAACIVLGAVSEYCDEFKCSGRQGWLITCSLVSLIVTAVLMFLAIAGEVLPGIMRFMNLVEVIIFIALFVWWATGTAVAVSPRSNFSPVVEGLSVSILFIVGAVLLERVSRIRLDCLGKKKDDEDADAAEPAAATA